MDELSQLLALRRVLEDPGGGTFLADALLRVRNRAGQCVPLRANPVQRSFEARRGRHNIVLKARQMGLTTWIAGRLLLKTITEGGVLTVQVAHTREAAEAIFAVAERMWTELPEEWKRGPLRRRRANRGQMIFGALDSEFRVVSAAEQNAGRGLTIQNLHLSEVARWPGDAGATLAGLRAALAPGGEMTLESTPDGAAGAFYNEWMQAGDGQGQEALVRHFFPWWMEPAYVGPEVLDWTADEAALVRMHGLTAAQIGFRRGLEQGFRELRAQEFAEDPGTCFRASGDCCFDVEALERRMENLPEPLESRRGGALLVWLPPLPGKEYLVAADTAGGGSTGDFACVQVVELGSGLQCAELRERLTPAELAHAAARLAREYGGAEGRTEIAVERNNHGFAVLAYLAESERYRRLYAQDGVAGWLTSAASKPVMVGRLGALLSERPELFFSARLLAECRGFQRFGNGRTGAAPGAHDDCVMSMAIAQAVRAERLERR